MVKITFLLLHRLFLPTTIKKDVVLSFPGNQLPEGTGSRKKKHLLVQTPARTYGCNTNHIAIAGVLSVNAYL